MEKSFLGYYSKDYEDMFSCEQNRLYKLYFSSNIKHQRPCILKIISKENIKKFDYNLILEQINKSEEHMKLCKSKNIVELYKKLETNTHIIFELEYFDTNLYDGIIYKSESLANNQTLLRQIILDIAKALKITHEKGIIHRDIKPKNIFFNNEEEKVFKLGNFICSIGIKDNRSNPMGTVLYSAPEILKNMDYNEKCDLWSLGVTLYELYFGILPYGVSSNLNFDKIMNYIYSEKFLLKKSKIPSFDILLNRLLTREQEERMSFDEFFQFVFDENFMLNEEAFLKDKPKYKELYDIISKEGEPFYPDLIINDIYSPIESRRKVVNEIMNTVKDISFYDITNIYDRIDKELFNNILYFEENNQFKKEIYENSDYFSTITPGAFIFCNDISSLNLISNEIISQNKKDKRIIFNLITSGNSCDKIMKFLNSNIDFKNCINKICIYCFNRDKWSHLKNKYNIIYGIFNTIKDIKEFIEKLSSKDIKPFPLSKLMTYKNYIESYKNIHEIISKLYGNVSPEDCQKLKNYTLHGFMYFDFDKDFMIFKKIISNHINETFYNDLYKWINNYSDKGQYEELIYYISRFIYYINTYAKENKKYFEEDKTILKKGIKMPYSNLMQYTRAIGKIILFSDFISVNDSELDSKQKSGRNLSKEQYKFNNLFSVIFIISNNYQKNWISNGIIINGKKDNNFKKEILYLPFTFFLLKEVNIDFANYSADIYLETIGKKEILEEKMKEGKEFIYNAEENIMEIKK